MTSYFEILKHVKLAALIAIAIVTVAGCGDAAMPAPCAECPYPDQWTVTVSATAPEAVKIAADDIVKYLGLMGVTATLDDTGAAINCAAGLGRVVFSGDGIDEPVFETASPSDQTFRYEETWCGDGALVTLSGGGLLGRQYAAYDWLNSLGVRFFHPEEEYVPATLAKPTKPALREFTPAFKYRSVSLHLTHPLEMGDAFSLNKPEYLRDAINYIDWTIKNLASDGRGGVGIEGYESYGRMRGFPTSTGFRLYGMQQGNPGLVDLDDPRPPIEQITDKMTELMGTDPENFPDFFSFNFDPTEFTEIDDETIVDLMTQIAGFIDENYPGVQIVTTNHGTHGEPTEHYGVRYYNLPQFAPESVGVKCHTLMFYDMERPAPVYGNENFNFMYDFMEQEYKKRQLWFFPESAWWLTFDNQIPLYLPITIEARDRDIQKIKHMLTGKLVGHHTFGTGHEWGYWQNEYCSFKMAADTDYRYTDCLGDITRPMGATAAAEVQEVLETVITLQENEMIFGNILRYLVGSDPETEAAASVGVIFHPLPPSPKAIMQWTAEEAQAWLDREGVELADMVTSYAALVARLDAVRDQVNPSAQSWFNEIYDGIKLTGMRADHQLKDYGAVVKFRLAQLNVDADMKAAALADFATGQAVTADARALVAEREKSYRYAPLERSIGGGEACNEDSNWSTYAYRVHCRTHVVYYWSRIDELVGDVLLNTSQIVLLADSFLSRDMIFRVDVADPAITSVDIDFGDGTTDSGTTFSHFYTATGTYQITVSGTREGTPFEWSADIAVVETETMTEFTGKITAPTGMDIVQSIMPNIMFGRIDEDTMAMGYSADHPGNVQPGVFSLLADNGDPVFGGTAETLMVPIVTKSDNSILAQLTVKTAVVSTASEGKKLKIEGKMSTESVINAVVVVGNGGFDAAGARELVASTIGYTSDTLPEYVDFVIEYDIL